MKGLVCGQLSCYVLRMKELFNPANNRYWPIRRDGIPNISPAPSPDKRGMMLIRPLRLRHLQGSYLKSMVGFGDVNKRRGTKTEKVFMHPATHLILYLTI